MLFSDVLTIKNGRNQKAVENPDGMYPIYGSGGIMGYADDYICAANTVVIGRKGSINNPIFVDRPFWNVDTAFGLEAKDDVLMPRYLYYFCKHFNFEKLNKTVTIPSLTKSDLLKIEIDLPTLSEQRTIVAQISKVEVIINHRQQELQKLDELVKARFVELFGDPMLNPKGFPVKTIEEVSVLNKGITYSPEEVADEGMIVLRSSNIKGNVFDLEDLVKITKKISPDKFVHENDILMCNRNGSARLVGKVAIIPKLDEDMTFGTFMTIVRSDIYEYLFAFFQMDAFREQIKFQTAVAINQISLPLLASVKVPVPPRTLIDEFAVYTKQVDKSKAAVKQSLEKTQLLFDCLMQQYFG